MGILEETWLDEKEICEKCGGSKLSHSSETDLYTCKECGHTSIDCDYSECGENCKCSECAKETNYLKW